MRLELIFTVALMSISSACFAQKAQIKEGNKLYQEKKYADAAAAYQKALMKEPKNATAIFNLGDALYQQKNYAGARQTLNAAASLPGNKTLSANAWYNIGNSYMEEKKWKEAIEEYKKALRNNPQDEAAKYNLSYALEMLKKEQGGGGKNNDQNKDQNKDGKDNKDQQDKDGQNQDKDQQQDQKDQQQGDNGKDKKDQQDQPQQNKQQPQPGKLSQQQADQLLNALSQEEKQLHDKKEKGKAVPVKLDKDW